MFWLFPWCQFNVICQDSYWYRKLNESVKGVSVISTTVLYLVLSQFPFPFYLNAFIYIRCTAIFGSNWAEFKFKIHSCLLFKIADSLNLFFRLKFGPVFFHYRPSLVIKWQQTKISRFARLFLQKREFTDVNKLKEIKANSIRFAH